MVICRGSQEENPECKHLIFRDNHEMAPSPPLSPWACLREAVSAKAGERGG